MRSRIGSLCAAISASAILIPCAPVWAQSPLATLPPSAPVASSTFAGIYQGKIAIGSGISLTLVFHVVESTDGKRTATLDVPEQSATGVPVTSVAMAGDSVTIHLDNLKALFTGKITTDRASITGTFTQLGHDFPLTLERTDKPLVLERPQTPKPPFPYHMEDVSYPNPKAPGVTLAATLDIPEGKGPFPVVVFITGSGPQDRDEEILGHRPFLVIADYLARRGIASLRADDRGTAKSTGNFATATTADFATDTRAGVDYLKTRTDVIDAKRIGLIGHSEGGVIAPIVAASDPDVAYIIMLAGTGVRGDKLMLAQQRAIAQTLGLGDKTLTTMHTTMAQIYDIIESSTDQALVSKKLKSFETHMVATVPVAQHATVRKQLDAAITQVSSPWFEYLLRYDPAPTLKQIHCPVLAIDGTKGSQVLPDQNLPAIKAALAAGGNKDVTIDLIPNLNHLFQHTKTGSPSEYASNSETFAPEALAIVGDWIVAHTQTKP